MAATLTFGDQAENHVGMQKIGELADEGFSIEDLRNFERKLNEKFEVELISLESENLETPEAAVLIVRNFVKKPQKLLDEILSHEWDTQALMYGRVVNKHARHNLCFSVESQEPDYAAGKGRIVSYTDSPLLARLRTSLPRVFGRKARDLECEGNLYFDPKKCGIGFHGDSERRKVIGVRLGESIPLVYCWYYKSNPVSDPRVLSLNSGDLYIMSEKATGNDWKRKNIYTLRHAAGCKKYTGIEM